MAGEGANWWTVALLANMTVAGVGLRTGEPSGELVGTDGKDPITGEALVQIAGEALVQIAGEALVQLVEPNLAGGLTTAPLLVSQLDPNFQPPFDAGLVGGQDVGGPGVSDPLVVQVRRDWLVGRASSEASWQLVALLVGQMVAGAPAGVVGEDSAGEAGVGFAPTGAPPAVWMQ